MKLALRKARLVAHLLHGMWIVATRFSKVGADGRQTLNREWSLKMLRLCGMRLVVPARISAAARDRVRATALEAFARLGCSGLARADFFVEGDDVLLNELNTMPGFTPTSVYAKLWEEARKNPKQAIAIALSEARRSGAKVPPPKKKATSKRKA